MNKGFKIGDLVWNMTPSMIDAVNSGFKRPIRRGVIVSIQYDNSDTPHTAGMVSIKNSSGEIYSDYFYVFELDKEKYREDKLNKLLM